MRLVGKGREKGNEGVGYRDSQETGAASFQLPEAPSSTRVLGRALREWRVMGGGKPEGHSKRHLCRQSAGEDDLRNGQLNQDMWEYLED